MWTMAAAIVALISSTIPTFEGRLTDLMTVALGTAWIQVGPQNETLHQHHQ